VGELEQGARVGRYILLKSVGHGGMGVVYAAYDPELDRKVALKLLRSDKQAPAGLTAREWLLREAQAMARVSHPNVIPIYDVGTFGSQVFLAMEFIQGRTLQEWIRQEGHSWRDTLRVFLQAGEGLVAAHRVGLVHRDFKPANVLLSHTGRVYVLDFGLALLAETAGQEEASRSGEVLASPERGGELVLALQAGLAMGTPQYMPPEQYLDHRVDARADQFSFCASLYWALFRQRPFEPRQMARAASEASRGAPSSTEAWRRLPHESAIEPPPAQVRVPAWVRRAVLRGMAVHPDDRFPSMEALLEALSQQRRRARGSRALAAVGLLGVAGLGVGAYLHRQGQLCAGSEQLAAQVWNPAARQKLEAAFAATGKPFAAESARAVVGALGGYADQWTRMHTEACEATRVRGVQTEELLSLRMVCLERRRQDLRALTGLLTEADTALVVRAVDAAAALPALEPCQDITSLAEQPPPPADPARRATLERLGEALAQVKALHDAGRYRVALEQARKLEPEVAATAWLPLRAELHTLEGWLLHQQGETEAGLRKLEQAFNEAAASRSDGVVLDALARFTFTLAVNGQPDEARRWGGLAQSVLQRLGNEPSLAWNLMRNLGNVALLQGHYREAWSYFDKARTLQQQVLSPEDPRRARVTYDLGITAMRMGEHPQAIALLTEALLKTEAAKGRQHPDTATRRTMLATAYRESGDAARALPHIQTALEDRKAALGAEHPAVADALDELGMSLLALKRHGEAISTFQEAVALKRRVQGGDHPDLSFSYDGLGQALLAGGRAAEALEPLRKALSYDDTEPELLAESGFALARALWDVGQPAQAREEARRARERYVKLEKAARVAELDTWLASRRALPSGQQAP
jgi:tetratricopeptide (TPR) repeat protein/predicted Ser/Thr protein kinase